MARKNEPKMKTPDGGGQNRVQGFVFGISLEGSDEVVTEGIKAFTNAMTKGGLLVTQIAPVQPVLPAEKAKPIGEMVEHGHGLSEDLGEQSESEDFEDEELAPSSNGNGSAGKRNYTFKAPKFLHDLDMSKAPKPLSNFMVEKGSPTDTIDRYIVIAAWLKEFMGVDEFTINHIWTAYNALGWKAQFPENHSQPLRDLKSKKNFLSKEKGAGYKVSWPGEQYVTKMGS